MSNALKAVVGVVLIVVGVAFPVTAEYLIPLGASLLLNAAASLFVKAARAPPLSGISINYSGTLEPRRLIYGTLKMGGINCLPPITSGPGHDIADIAVALDSSP